MTSKALGGTIESEGSTSTRRTLRRSTSPREAGSTAPVASSWARMLPRALASGVPTTTRRLQAAAVIAENTEFKKGNLISMLAGQAALDALDLHYRAHWAVRQAQMEQADPPGGLIPGVVLERHYALNWLVRFEDAPWDEVDTPT